MHYIATLTATMLLPRTRRRRDALQASVGVAGLTSLAPRRDRRLGPRSSKGDLFLVQHKLSHKAPILASAPTSRATATSEGPRPRGAVRASSPAPPAMTGTAPWQATLPRSSTSLYAGGVDPDVGVGAFECSVSKALDLFIELFAQLRARQTRSWRAPVGSGCPRTEAAHVGKAIAFTNPTDRLPSLLRC